MLTMNWVTALTKMTLSSGLSVSDGNAAPGSYLQEHKQSQGKASHTHTHAQTTVNKKQVVSSNTHTHARTHNSEEAGSVVPRQHPPQVNVEMKVIEDKSYVPLPPAFTPTPTALVRHGPAVVSPAPKHFEKVANHDYSVFDQLTDYICHIRLHRAEISLKINIKMTFNPNPKQTAYGTKTEYLL